MSGWKKNLVPVLFAFAGALFLIPAILTPLMYGEPFKNSHLVFAMVFFVFAAVSYAVTRKPGSGPPSA